MTSNDYIQAAHVDVKQYTLDKTNSVHANTRQGYILGSWSWSTWYIYIDIRIVIYVINYYSTRKFAMKNAHILTRPYSVTIIDIHRVLGLTPIEWLHPIYNIRQLSCTAGTLTGVMMSKNPYDISNIKPVRLIFQKNRPSLIHIMTSHQIGAKPSLKPKLYDVIRALHYQRIIMCIWIDGGFTPA